ncbi:putative receptor-like protein kinase [Hibiscus syriacus]|uniref:non-specific serine/threonine protein kinase n=1 Tax=Hibiscus syriacus TaxID=106335 RepID=A0A6A3AUM3_HIBSY|nr:putative receptor-like protein kinase [Hibiscus syriacus]
MAAAVPPVASSPSLSSFKPSDSYCINCGASSEVKLDDGRVFKPDTQKCSYLSADEDVSTTTDSIPVSAFMNSSPSSLMDLYKAVRIFTSDSTYLFFISEHGKHWVCLYFYPLHHEKYDFKTAVFTAQTNKCVLLHDFSMNDSKVVLKEYLVNATTHISIIFKPRKDFFAFINALEIVGIPGELLSDSASSVAQGNTVNDLSDVTLEVLYRLNIGGPLITPKNDTLARTLAPDKPYNVFPQGTKVVKGRNIKYRPDRNVIRLIAPEMVYAMVARMTTTSYAHTIWPNFNISWAMRVEGTFSYFIRMHFCDVVSRAKNELHFNVYINELMGISGLDLSEKADDLAIAYYTYYVLNASSITNDSVIVQVGPITNTGSSTQNAILNGLQVMKMSNIADSLDGLYVVDGSYKGTKFSTPKVLSSKVNYSSRKSNVFGSRLSSVYGKCFTLLELQNATQIFDQKAVISVSGFGKVFIGTLDDGTKVVIKRGNHGSEQGVNEFETEIQMLSKFRHRHLVSLIGFCDEDSEMIVVYEYMANGPLRDHLYGAANKPTLTWKQRLEICIGTARGLHYLHTGATQGIIHRDVKTTNILLDDNFVAKVSDFGLSKAAAMDQGHVSTAVKGSFGYLDLEYFRRQQLTEKSDVYSFGVVLFEVLCARAVICPALPMDQVSLSDWAMQWHKKGMIEKIVDYKITGQSVKDR